MRYPKTSTPLKAADPTREDVSMQQIEAARYAVLRRLAPCLRHHMVRPLQPIGLIYGVMHHKLLAPTPDLESVREEAEKINVFAKAALEECNDMGTWLAPEPGVLTGLDAGVRECVGLMATMLHFCGFRLNNEVDGLPVLVQRDAVRMVVSAALLALTDAMSEQATLTLCGTASNGHASLSLQIAASGEGAVDRYDDGYRKLVWGDVQALALAEQVELSREGDLVRMRFTVETAPAD